MLQMRYPTRIYYTEADKALMWYRWPKGESLNEIGRHCDRSHTSIQNILSQKGGIRPPERKRSRRSLSLSEREQTSRGLVLPAARSDRLQPVWNAYRRVLVERSVVTAAGDARGDTNLRRGAAEQVQALLISK
jgi:hypothetical protein